MPCHRRSAFHSLWPCRSNNRRVQDVVVASSIPADTTDGSTLCAMATIRLFAAAREAAGIGRDELPGDTVGEVLGQARDRYGDRFSAVLENCKIWVNGEPADSHDAIGTADELAVIPPVSGGSW